MPETTSPPQRPFKVIIAGGSVAGLTLANVLERAGVEYVLLEKRDVVPDVGQTILVMPCTALVLEQLGCHALVEAVGFPIKTREHFDTDMKLFSSSDEMWRLYKQAGRPVRFLDRFRFLKSLHDGIEDKSKIHTREGLVSYTETEHGVEVRTDKGNVVEGSILVGCDGVHSEVRRQMAAQLRAEDPAAARVLSTGFATRYCCLTSLSHNHHAGDDEKRPLLRDGTAVNSYHPRERVGGISAAGTPGQLAWSAYMPLESIDRQPVGAYPSPRFTQADVDVFMARYGHLHLGPGYTFADAYSNMVKGASIIAMEENVLPTRWHSGGGRVVLLGDAVHKATANLGLGGNLCVDDVCRLANGLVPLLSSSSAAAAAPSTAQLVRVFADVERASRPRAEFVRRASRFFCGLETGTAWYAPVARALLPWVPSSVKMRVFGWFDAAAPKLDFLPVPAATFRGGDD